MSGRRRYIACIVGLLALTGLAAGDLALPARAQPAAVRPAAVAPAAVRPAASDLLVKTQQRRQKNLFDFLFGAPRSRPSRRFQPPRFAPPEAVRKSRPAPAARAVKPEVSKESGAQKVYVFGDAFATGLAGSLVAAFSESPTVQIMESTKGNSGIVRDDYYDWGSELADILAKDDDDNEGDVDVAVVMIGSNDRQPIRAENGSWLQMRSEQWEKIYISRVDALLDQFTEKGIPVYWVGLPIMRPQSYARDMAYLNEVFLARVQRAGGKFIDTWARFADEEGRFSAMGPDINGKNRTLRASNGISLTRTGKEKLAFFVEQVLKPDLERGGGVALITNFGSGTVNGRRRGPVEIEMSLTSPGNPPINAELAGGPPTVEQVEVEKLAAVMLPDGPIGGLMDEAMVLAAAKKIAKQAAEQAARKLARKAGQAAKHRRIDYQLLVIGQSPPPKPGRADDFTWPRGAAAAAEDEIE